MSHDGALSIPPGWEDVALEDCCEVIQGQSPPGSTYNGVGEGLPFFQGKSEFGDVYPTPAKWCSSPTKIAQPDDVLISIRAPVGPTNLAPSVSCIGRGLAAVRPRAGILPRYVLYALRATVDDLTARATGSTFEAISGAALRSHRVRLAPLPEQHRIVAAIEKHFTRLDAAVAELEQARARLKRYRAAVLGAACAGRLVPTAAELALVEGSAYEPAAVLLERIAATKGRQSRGESGKDNRQVSEPQVPPGWQVATIEETVAAGGLFIDGDWVESKDQERVAKLLGHPVDGAVGRGTPRHREALSAFPVPGRPQAFPTSAARYPART